jgi:hypothetical protein
LQNTIQHEQFEHQNVANTTEKKRSELQNVAEYRRNGSFQLQNAATTKVNGQDGTGDPKKIKNGKTNPKTILDP